MVPPPIWSFRAGSRVLRRPGRVEGVPTEDGNGGSRFRAGWLRSNGMDARCWGAVRSAVLPLDAQSRRVRG
jgi:hypothetical protein